MLDTSVVSKLTAELYWNYDERFENKFAPEKQKEIKMVQWVMPADTNAYGVAFGGTLFGWMDMAGVALTQKWSKSKVVTLAVEHFIYKKSVPLGALVTIDVSLIGTGKTSMDTRIALTYELPSQGNVEVIAAAEGFFTYVACDEFGKSKQVPQWHASNSWERAQFEMATERRISRQNRRFHHK